MAYFCSCCRRRSISPHGNPSAVIELAQLQMGHSRRSGVHITLPPTQSRVIRSWSPVEQSIPTTQSHDANEEFSYAKLFNTTNVETDFQVIFSEASAFIDFYCNDFKDNATAGWKLHIAVDDEYNNLAAAWNLVKDILIGYRIPHSKVVKPNVQLSTDKLQHGKQITIYIPEADDLIKELDWALIVYKIELSLRSYKGVGITTEKLGFSPSDKAIPGSKYISYRNDSDLNAYGDLILINEIHDQNTLLNSRYYFGLSNKTYFWSKNGFFYIDKTNNEFIVLSKRPKPPMTSRPDIDKRSELSGKKFERDIAKFESLMDKLNKLLKIYNQPQNIARRLSEKEVRMISKIIGYTLPDGYGVLDAEIAVQMAIDGAQYGVEAYNPFKIDDPLSGFSIIIQNGRLQIEHRV